MATDVLPWLPLMVLLHVLPGIAVGQQHAAIRINADQGPLSGLIHPLDEFGRAVASLGDLDGDGNQDLMVGAPRTYRDGLDRGDVYILFLDSDFHVARVKSLSSQDLVRAALSDKDLFGNAVLNLGDLNGDGNIEVAVGAPGYDLRKGAVWLLSLSRSGDVTASYIVESGAAGSLDLANNDRFGLALAKLDDLDGDGVPELAVGAPYAKSDEDLTTIVNSQGEIWLVPLIVTSNGLAIDPARVSRSSPEFQDRLLPDVGMRFGQAVVQIADFDADGVGDVAIGAPTDATGGRIVGSVLHAGINTSGMLKDQRVLAFGSAISEQMGSALALSDDIDGNSIRELLVGVPFKSGSQPEQGQVYRLFLDPGGGIITVDSLSESPGLDLGDGSHFGSALDIVPDLDGDGLSEIVVGAPEANSDRPDNVWIVFGHPISRPAISDVVVWPGSIPSASAAVSISADIVDPSGIRRAWLDLRRGGEEAWLSIPLLAKPGPTYFADIPGEFLGDRGFEFVVRASNGVGQGAGLEARYPETGFHSVQLTLPDGLSFVARRGATQGDYQLISVPLDLETKSARQNLTDDLGLPDVRTWRMIRHSAYGQTDISVVDFDIEPGRAYWFLSGQANRTVDVGSGRTTASNEAFEISLEPGWNLIGTPFTFELPLSALRLDSSEPIDLRSFENGAWSSDVTEIRPYEGYAVWNKLNTADVLLIDPTRRATGDESAATLEIGSSTNRREALLAKLLPQTAGADERLLPRQIPATIERAYPNPTRSSITIECKLSRTATVDLVVFDVLGRRVGTILRSEVRPGGNFVSQFSFAVGPIDRPAPGTYLLRLSADGALVSTRMFTLVR